MPGKKRIFVTGVQGLIGRPLSDALRKRGYDVFGVSRRSPLDDHTVGADLLSPGHTASALKEAKPFSVVIHTAALAHGQSPPPGMTVCDVNVAITRNVLDAVEDQAPHFIHLSSIAVYADRWSSDPKAVGDETTPTSAYGESKLQCEKLVLESSLEHCDILRLAPVHDESYRTNIANRVRIPGFSRLNMKLYPPPFHSLCHLDTVVQLVCDIVEAGPRGRVIRNVCDPRPHSQHDLVTQIPGIAVPVPVVLLSPLYGLLHLIPFGTGRALRSLFRRLFHSNLYSSEDTQE